MLAAIQRVPPAEPVKTQIAARLIVMLGSAPELGFMCSLSTKTGKSNSTTNCIGREYSILRGWGNVTAGLYGVEEMSLGRGGAT